MIDFKPALNRVWVDDSEVVLTALELRLLRLLWLNRGSLIFYTEIIGVVWEEEDYELNDYKVLLIMLVKRLRKKIGVGVIQNRRGIGYGIL